MSDVEQKIAAHDALAGGVFLVAVYNKEAFVQHAIFSEFAKAKEWMHSLPSHLTCMCAPFVVDVPDVEAGAAQ